MGTITDKYFLDDPFSELWPEKPEKYPYDLTTHPTARCAMALSAYNKGDMEKFQEHLKWILDNQNQQTGGLEVWFDWDVPGYKAKAPWISCMTQGMMLSVLARAGRKEAIERAVQPFSVHIDIGGLVQRVELGRVQFQGVPSKHMSDIFNESLFAIIGLYEAADILGGKMNPAWIAAEQGRTDIMCKLCASKLDIKLPFFRWSRYDSGMFWYSGAKYHRVMVKQLEWLNEHTWTRFCAPQAEKWRKWDDMYSGSKAEWFWLKVWRFYGYWVKWGHKKNKEVENGS